MRGVVLLGVFCGLIGACSGAPAGPIIVEQPGRVVIVQSPVPVSEGGVESTDDAGAEASVDGSASVADGAPATCTGPNAIDGASDDCEARGSCSLSTCTGGEAFTCTSPSGAGPSSGHPAILVGCVESAADEAALSTGIGHVYCCERVCVRHSSDDADCRSTAISCPTGVAPSPPSGTTTCSKSTTRPNGYCCR